MWTGIRDNVAGDILTAWTADYSLSLSLSLSLCLGGKVSARSPPEIQDVKRAESPAHSHSHSYMPDGAASRRARYRARFETRDI